jgi:hypothetical protein
VSGLAGAQRKAKTDCPRHRGLADAARTAAELLSRLALRVNHEDIQAFDLLHRATGNALKVAVEAGGRVEHASELFLALRS